MKAAIINVSTAGYIGEMEDTVGPVVKRALEQVGFKVGFMKSLPEDKEVLSKIMALLCDENSADFIVTCGKTGIAKEDCTPDATLAIIERELPGIPEALRFYNMRYTKRTMLSRGVSGIRNKTLILNLPDSPKSVNECLEYVLPEVVYAVEILTGKKEA